MKTTSSLFTFKLYKTTLYKLNLSIDNDVVYTYISLGHMILRMHFIFGTFVFRDFIKYAMSGNVLYINYVSLEIRKLNFSSIFYNIKLNIISTLIVL